MDNSSLSKPHAIAFAVLGFIGFADATYLAAKFYLGTPIPCSLTGGGCDIVTKSVYGSIMGIPISAIGALYYVIVVILALVALDRRSHRPLTFASLLVTAGFIISGILFYIQAFVLRSFCLYCLVSAALSTLLAANALILTLRTRWSRAKDAIQ